MPRMTWDDIGKRLYETGVSECALYVQSGGAYPAGVPWNGVTAINETPSGAEPTALYANNSKYLTLFSVEELGGTIEAYTFPDEFGECDGSAELVKGVYVSQQNRKSFGLAYKSIIGNDTNGDKHGYKLNLIYGAMASPTEKSHSSVNDSPDVNPFSWEFSTTPVSVTGMKPTSKIVIDSTKADPTKLAKLEKILYGDDDGGGPRLPLPDEVKTIMTPSEE